MRVQGEMGEVVQALPEGSTIRYQILPHESQAWKVLG